MAETYSAAVLQVNNDKDFDFGVDTCSSSSNRSSLSSIDSNHDHTSPLELGLVINALQTTMSNQPEESQPVTTDQVEILPKEAPMAPSPSPVISRPIKREEAIIVDYELDHGVDRSVRKISNTTGSANLIVIDRVDPKLVKPNTLTPREQEREDEPILRAIHHLFSNRFMKAKRLFEEQAKTDPLHALGLSSMAFLKALMTTNQQATDDAIEVLMSTYSIASAQIDNATKKNVGGVPTSVAPAKPKALENHKVDTIPNGTLRAHVVKAEACLQMAILHLMQENVTGYVKCGLNLRRAYASYSLVWQEYKRMGQLHNEYIDSDTISGIQFGIGAVHLVLSSLPQKILRTVSTFGWKADKHLGFALLKLCLENRKARSSMASVMLLAYYTTLTSWCPQILADEYTQPAIETLLDAQKTYPNSAIFLYFAGKTSRLARNLSLSTQSFTYAIEVSKNEWAEVEVLHMCSYEMGFNYMMGNNWEDAAKIFDTLYKERYWSQPIFRYLTGACLDMLGQRTEAILAYAEVAHLLKSSGSKNSSTQCIEQYILRKIQLFQSSGYQDMDMTMCALEYMYLFNAYEFMDSTQLEQNLLLVDYALSRVLEAEKLEYSIRTKELLPETPPPEYHDQRGALLLIKASILNAMGQHQDSIIHLNWIIDHKHKISADKWIIPYAYWEVGMTAWNLQQKSRARGFWEHALTYSNYDFEYRLAMRVNLAVTRAAELGIEKLELGNKKSIMVVRTEHSEQVNCDSINASQCNSDEEEEEKDVNDEEETSTDVDLELEPVATPNTMEKAEVDDDKSSTKSIQSNTTANTECQPEKMAEEIEQIVDQLRLGSDRPSVEIS